MKGLMFIVTCVLFCSLSTDNIADLRNNLIGKWEYRYSWVGQSKKRIEPDNFIPVYRMEFRPCKDSLDLKTMPKSVINMRETNVLKNICGAYYNGKNNLLDLVYPVVLNGENDLSQAISIVDYGRKYEAEYFIDTLNTNKLVLHDNVIYEFEGQKYHEVKHVYLKK